jgi:hypothetical protein
MTRAADRVLRGAGIAVIAGLAALSLAMPASLFTGAIAWLVVLCFVLSGLGWLVVRASGVEDPDFGLRAVWGAAAYLAIAGPLVMLGVCSRPVVLALIALGFVGFAWRELVTPAPLSARIRAGGRFMRAQPLIGYLAVVLGAVAVMHVLGGIAQLSRNAWDDDIAYTPLLGRLLQIGDLVEPFSFRRLGAYGGQTVMQAMVGARGTLANIHLFDQSLCFALVISLVIGYARALQASAVTLGVCVLLLLLVPDIWINTGSYWSGVAFFLGLYRTIARSETSPRAHLALAGLVAAATCTLRQNYIPVAVAFFALALVSRIQRGAGESTWREAWRAEWKQWRLAILVAVAVLVPWCIAAFVSSRTFLFPFMQGTWNHGLTLSPTAWSWVDELSFFISCCLETQPLAIIPLLFPLLACTVDERRARPLTALFVASIAGFLLMVHSFQGSDSFSLYAFGYAFPLTLVFVLEVGGSIDVRPVRLAPLGRWILLAAVLIQLAMLRGDVVKHYAAVAIDLREAIALDRHGDPEAVVEQRRYAAMQAAIPAGARVAVMFDDAVFLDYARNDIANLDTPGYASPGVQMPSFTGAEAMRAYFLSEHIRYLAYVRPERSRYFYRRGFWLWRVFHDAELFQVMSAYVLDAIDTFEALRTSSKVLYDADGLVVLDLDKPHGPPPRLDPAGEPMRRDAFVRALADREHLHGAWALSSRYDLVFADGFSGVTLLDSEADPHWYELLYTNPEPEVGIPARWMTWRSHLRVRGERDMHLVVRGKVNLNQVYSRPRIDVSLDGELLSSFTVDERGDFTIELVVPKAKLDGWCDLYLVFNTVGQPEREVRNVRAARLSDVVWEPR